MSATLTTSPASPASAHRPLVFTLTRTDPALSRVFFIRPATAGDVATLGNGLVEGDILVQHQAWAGAVPGIAGQTINLLATCLQYAGVWTILSAFTVSGDLYSVIDAPDLGAFDPSPGFGDGRVWLNGYTLWAEVSTYTDPAGDPHIAYLRGTCDLDGVATFNVAPTVASYFSEEIHPYVLPWTGTLIQHAHGITALFYRVRFLEVYDVPGTTTAVNPWESGTEVHADSAHRVAVNAVHPYHSDLLTWETASLEAFRIGTPSAKFLTFAPRVITLSDTDSFRVHLLTDPDESYQVTGGAAIRVRQVNPDGSTTSLGTEGVDLGSTAVAAVSLAVGPADLAAAFILPSRYRVYFTDRNGEESEALEVIVDTACKEVRRPLAWLNPLGGVDLYTFTGREIETADAARTTLRKPMGTGTGYDWAERGNTTTPATRFTLSTAPVSAELRAWIVRGLLRTAAACLKLSATQATPVVLASGGIVASNTAGIYKPVTIEYRRGTDNQPVQA